MKYLILLALVVQALAFPPGQPRDPGRGGKGGPGGPGGPEGPGAPAFPGGHGGHGGPGGLNVPSGPPPSIGNDNLFDNQNVTGLPPLSDFPLGVNSARHRRESLQVLGSAPPKTGNPPPSPNGQTANVPQPAGGNPGATGNPLPPPNGQAANIPRPAGGKPGAPGNPPVRGPSQNIPKKN